MKAAWIGVVGMMMGLGSAPLANAEPLPVLRQAVGAYSLSVPAVFAGQALSCSVTGLVLSSDKFVAGATVWGASGQAGFIGGDVVLGQSPATDPDGIARTFNVPGWAEYGEVLVRTTTVTTEPGASMDALVVSVVDHNGAVIATGKVASSEGGKGQVEYKLTFSAAAGQAKTWTLRIAESQDAANPTTWTLDEVWVYVGCDTTPGFSAVPFG